MYKFIIACVLTISGIGSASARGIAEGTVNRLTAASASTNVFLSADITAVSGETLPACSTSVKYMVLSSDQKNQLAILLTAMALGKAVKLVGAGTCNVNPTKEDISFIQIID